LTFPEFLSTLWRRRLTIVVSVVVTVVAALAYSKLQTPMYKSTALIQINSTSGQTGQSTTPVTLPDPVQSLGSTAVQLGAAKILGNPNVEAVASEVTGTVDPTSGALTITATASTPEQAQAVAKAYSQAYVNQTQALVQAQSAKIDIVLNGLDAKLATVEAQPSSPLTSAQIAALTQTASSLQTEQENILLGEPYASIQVAAQLPTSPTGLSKSKLGAIGLVAGLLVGCGIALARDQFDTRIRTSPDFESVTESPILAELPEDPEVRSGTVAIAMVQAPQSAMAESVRELRTSLRVILDETPGPLIVITSPEPGDGKTFVTANLAAAWAMSGSKVIVVSADFRRPRLEEIFGLQVSGRPGLADLIRANWKKPEIDDRPQVSRDDRETPNKGGDRRVPLIQRNSSSRNDGEIGSVADQPSVASLLVETGIWGLQLLPAGTSLDNPSELFGSPGMQPVLDQLLLSADIVLLDTPPILSVPDTAIIGSLARNAVIVASEGRTDRGDLERTVRRLNATNCHVLGIALNRVRRTSSDSYRSYAYKQ
jgi:Mrp family chromosome partitioning ATPase/LPS O-antigen subunit length determinant protein (WzzB/FepE family)